MTPSDQPRAPDRPDPPSAVPGHDLLRLIARGSYGEIWLARTELGAFRAVKIIRRANFADARPYDREFAGIQRYEPISREHEGLVDVLQVGCEEAAGCFFYVMELADDARAESEKASRGESGNHPRTHFPTCPPAGYLPLTLSHAIRARSRLPVDEVVTLGLNLARALEFLHSRRLLHRDVKPQNIIFVGGQPKLADVGLVAEVDGSQTLVGTDGYIPPEGPGTVQADIYSLGKVLYEAATGKDRQEFPDLGISNEETPDRTLLELNEVLLKACESQPRARYRTAAEMADDMERLLAGQSLRKRRNYRQRIQIIAIAAAVVAGIALLTAGLTAFVRHEHLKPQLLFRDDFDGSQLDAKLWKWSQKSWLPESAKGKPFSNVEQTAGDLSLKAMVEHERDTVGQATWVDHNWDFRRRPPCRIEISLSGWTRGGLLAVALTSGTSPSDVADPSGQQLALFLPESGETNVWTARTIRVDLLPESEAAIVHQDVNRSDDFDVVDLRNLATWHLRFYCATRTSMSFRPGISELNVERITAWTRQSANAVVGHVVEEISELPLGGAIISDNLRKQITKTLANGAFVIPRPPKGLITVEKSGFAPSRTQPLIVKSPSQVLDVRMRKLSPSFGDIVETASYNGANVLAIGSYEGTMLALVHGSDKACSLRRVDFDSRKGASLTTVFRTLELGDSDLIHSFAKCGDRLVGIKSWHGTLFDLDKAPPSLLTELSNVDRSPIDWPQGCAFDGKLFWFLESNNAKQRYRLHAVDLDSKELRHSIPGSDKPIYGLAWDGSRFWISEGYGLVYAVDREDAIRHRSLEISRGREFNGSYDRLAYEGGFLWGLQRDKRRICKIKISD